MSSRFDEMQTLNRLKAYRLGFFIFFAEIFLLLMSNYFIDSKLIADNYLLFFCGLAFIPGLVVMIYCIVTDAYDPINGKPAKIGFLLLAAFACIVLPGQVRLFVANPVDANNHINPVIISIILLLYDLIASIVYFFHYCIKKHND